MNQSNDMGELPGTGGCLAVGNGAIVAMLALASRTGTKTNPEPLVSFAKEHNLPLNFLVVDRARGNGEVHERFHDLFLGVEGELVFALGGTFNKAEWQEHAPGSGEWKRSGVESGRAFVLKPGAWLFIPAGTPHQNSCADGVAKAWVVKVPVVR